MITTTTEETLIGLAQMVRDWQKRQVPALSDEAMLRLYPGLGSTKTYKRIREGVLDGLVPDTHLVKYKGVWAAIETVTGASGQEEIYADLTPAMETAIATAGLIPQKGKTRLVLIEGQSGAGKTTALRLMAAKYVGLSVVVEAHEGWATLSCALGDLLVALGAKREDLPVSKAGRMDAILARLRNARQLILIDEGHHATAAVLNVLKTILNQTDSLIVLAGIDTLWRKLTAKSWEEARQLIHNRLYERVRLGAPNADDVQAFFTKRLGYEPSEAWRTVAARIGEMSASAGHYAFLRRVAEYAAAQPDRADAQTLLEAAGRIKAMLETR